jgi:hypothetical protein
MVHSFKGKAEACVNYFKNLFAKSLGCPILKILDVLNMFPRVISDEMNEVLDVEVFESKVLGVLSSMLRVPGLMVILLNST